jgi:hypothetical protein
MTDVRKGQIAGPMSSATRKKVAMVAARLPRGLNDAIGDEAIDLCIVVAKFAQ